MRRIVTKASDIQGIAFRYISVIMYIVDFLNKFIRFFFKTSFSDIAF